MEARVRRTSRRQTSQLPRWCDIPAAWASKSTPFFLRFLEPASKSIRFLEHPLARASAAAVELSADICYHSHTSSIEVWECDGASEFFSHVRDFGTAAAEVVGGTSDVRLRIGACRAQQDSTGNHRGRGRALSCVAFAGTAWLAQSAPLHGQRPYPGLLRAHPRRSRTPQENHPGMAPHIRRRKRRASGSAPCLIARRIPRSSGCCGRESLRGARAEFCASSQSIMPTWSPNTRTLASAPSRQRLRQTYAWV